MSDRSTSLTIQDYIRSQMAKGKCTGMVLLDLQKAFDAVVHEILINKLKAMGILSSAWFRSYLINWKQKAKINDTTPEQKLITCEVLQRSILGPLICLCYINDMESSVSCIMLLYTDDSVLSVSVKKTWRHIKHTNKGTSVCGVND